MTDRILEILDRYSARATFFCTGRNVERYPELFERIRSQGHGIGNHGYDHRSGKHCSDANYLADVERASRSIPSSLFRPPYGRMRRKQARLLAQRYRIVMWEVLSGDFDRGLSGMDCVEPLLRYSRPGSILLFHDSEKAKERVLEALPKVLEHFRNKGYSFPLIPGSRDGIGVDPLPQDPQ